MFSLPHADPGLHMLFEKLTAQVGGYIWQTPSSNYVSGVEDFMQCLSLLLISLLVT